MSMVAINLEFPKNFQIEKKLCDSDSMKQYIGVRSFRNIINSKYSKIT